MYARVHTSTSPCRGVTVHRWDFVNTPDKLFGAERDICKNSNYHMMYICGERYDMYDS